MKAAQESIMPGTVVVERYTRTDNGMGGGYETWAAVGTAIGRIYPRPLGRGRESVAGEQVTSTMQWYGTLPIGTDVLAKDRLLYQSRTWEVTTVNNDEMYQTCVRCELETLNEEQRT
jgi:head-tail adaptor